jgi:hypothetical protein
MDGNNVHSQAHHVDITAAHVCAHRYAVVGKHVKGRKIRNQKAHMYAGANGFYVLTVSSKAP